MEGVVLVSLLQPFLFADTEEQVENDAKDCCSSNAGNIEAEEGDVAAKGILAADTDYHDRGDDGNVLGAEEVDFLFQHNGDALGSYSAEEIYFQSPDDCVRDGVNGIDQRSEAGDNHGNDCGRDEDGNGEHSCNRHGADVFPVVGTCRAANEAGYHVANTVANEIEA